MGFVGEHRLRERQKLVQVIADDVDGNGQLQRLLVVHRNIAKTDHAFHGFGQVCR